VPDDPAPLRRFHADRLTVEIHPTRAALGRGAGQAAAGWLRARLARQLCHTNLAPGNYLPILAMSPAWEQAFAEAIIGQGEDRQLAMAPSQLQQFITSVRDRFEEASQKNEVPVLLTSPQIRPFVRSIVERFRTQTVVMSQNEIHASMRLRTLGQV